VPLRGDPVNIPRDRARQALGIGEEDVVLLSVGRPEKYRPMGSYDFVHTANRILERRPRARLLVVGESLPGIAPELRIQPHERLSFLGSIEDWSLYRAAADVYLESFPWGSQTCLLEAAMSGLPVVPAYSPLTPLLATNDECVSEVVNSPHDEDEYIDRTVQLIDDSDLRRELGHQLNARLVANHVGDGWLAHLKGVYQQTDALVHRPRLVPLTECCATPDDIGLSRWRIAADGRTFGGGRARESAVSVLCHAAYVSREVGRHNHARRSALRAVYGSPRDAAHWRLLAVTMLGPAAKPLRTGLRACGTFVRRVRSRKDASGGRGR